MLAVIEARLISHKKLGPSLTFFSEKYMRQTYKQADTSLLLYPYVYPRDQHNIWHVTHQIHDNKNDFKRLTQTAHIPLQPEFPRRGCSPSVQLRFWSEPSPTQS